MSSSTGVRKRVIGGLDPSLRNFGMSKGLLTIEEGEQSFLPTHIELVSPKDNKEIKYKNERDLQRAMELGEAMYAFFDGVDTIYVEIPVGSQSSRAMASYGICIGVIASLGKRVVRVSAKDVKLIATNDPQASKEDMIDWATSTYPELPWKTRKVKGEVNYSKINEHVADSLAAIHAGIKQTEV